METTILITIWIALGIHSAYYFVRSYTKSYDLTTSEIFMIVLCVIFPIATHISTFIVYGQNYGGDSKVIFKKRGQ